MNRRRFLGCFTISILLLGSPQSIVQNHCSVPMSCSSATKLLPTNDTTSSSPPCRCDEKCQLYDDCCFDAATSARERNDERSGQIECLMFPAVEKKQVFLVRRCPHSYLDANISVKCNNSTIDSSTDRYPKQLSIEYIFKTLPVSSKTTGILYRNAFCAICNEDFDFEFWKLRLNSKEPIQINHTSLTLTDLLGFINDTQVNYSAPRADLSARSCRPNVAECLPEWSQNVTEEVDFFRSECRRYQSYVQWNSVIFRNVHCARCNLVSEGNTSCADNEMTIQFEFCPLSYSVLLDFNSELWNIWTVPNSILGDRRPTDDDCDASNGTSCRCGSEDDSTEDRCLQVPTSFDPKNSGEPSGNLILAYLTFVGNILSVLSLSFLLLAYCCFPSLRNTPGRCLMCLCVSLLVAQLLFAAFGNYDNQILSYELTPVEAAENETTDNATLDQYNETESVLNKSTSPLDGNWSSTTISAASTVSDQPRVKMDTESYSENLMHVRYETPTWFTSNDSSHEDGILMPRLSSKPVQWTFRKDAKSIVCYASSLISHYFFLAYFCWSNTMAVDVWRTFRTLSSSLPSQAELRKRHFIYYSVYSWSVPAAIVTVAVVTDFIEASIRPLYAVRFCLISCPLGLILFLYVPCLLVTATNILLFVLSSVNICFSSMDDVQSRFGGRGLEGRQRLFLYVRLATVMGITWVSGLLASVTKSLVLWYVFVITTAFQGVYIALCFLATNQMRRMIKEKMKLNYTSSVLTKSTYK